MPRNTPNYVLSVELGLNEWYIYTMKVHMDYIINVVFNHSESRFTNFLAKIFIDLKLDWFKVWSDLGDRFGVSWEVRDQTI